MLVDPKLKPYAFAHGVERVELGVYKNTFNFGHLIEDEPSFENSYFTTGGIYSYGVIDSLEQLKEDYPEVFSDPRPMVLAICHIAKKKNDTGDPSYGTWRWHKWGEYIGRGKPSMEYLNDEEGFEDGVFVYHLYLLKTGQADNAGLVARYKVPKLSSLTIADKRGT